MSYPANVKDAVQELLKYTNEEMPMTSQQAVRELLASAWDDLDYLERWYPANNSLITTTRKLLLAIGLQAHQGVL